jgi:ubiquitin carboxyl-terminal hydrolase 36/42
MKHIKFEANINISRFYSTHSRQAKGQYELYAVLVHRGSEIWSGHYYCYVKNSNNMWYLMNDETVRLCKMEEVLQERAYLLFYRQIVFDSTPTAQPQVQSPSPSPKPANFLQSIVKNSILPTLAAPADTPKLQRTNTMPSSPLPNTGGASENGQSDANSKRRQLQDLIRELSRPRSGSNASNADQPMKPETPTKTTPQESVQPVVKSQPGRAAKAKAKPAGKSKSKGKRGKKSDSLSNPLDENDKEDNKEPPSPRMLW